MPTENSVLTVKNLFAHYDTRNDKNSDLVLVNLNFSVEKGELLCLCGPNGSGKSTLLSVLTNLKDNGIKFSENSVCVEGKQIEKLKREEIARKVSLMTQAENCQWNYSVKDFISLGRFVYGDEKSEYAKNLVQKVIQEMELENLAEKSVNSISGGEFQKVRIARSLVQETPVLLLDEPVANLDYEYQFKILGKIKELCSKTGKSAVISIHDLNVASVFADRIMLLGKCENQKQPFFIGKSVEVLNSSVLKEIYKTQMDVFEHPEYKVNQVYLKR